VRQIYDNLPGGIRSLMRRSVARLHFMTITQWNLVANKKKKKRSLEIGPGPRKLKGFEAINVAWTPALDYIGDASKKLPFEDATFDLIFASHIIEHLPWYSVQSSIRDWARCLKPGGELQIWTPDALKICEAFVKYEQTGDDSGMLEDDWFLMNPEKDLVMWASGRLFAVGDRKGTVNHPNWHRAMFSPRYLKEQMEKAGLVDVRQLAPEERKGRAQGWTDLGMSGCKK